MPSLTDQALFAVRVCGLRSFQGFAQGDWAGAPHKRTPELAGRRGCSVSGIGFWADSEAIHGMWNCMHSLELTWLRGEWPRRKTIFLYKPGVVHVTMLVAGRVMAAVYAS